MTDKEALDRLSSINMSIEQKQALIDVIKNIAKNNKSSDTYEYIILTRIDGTNSINIYDETYPNTSEFSHKVCVNNIELYNKLKNDLLNNKQIIVKTVFEEDIIVISNILEYYIDDIGISLLTLCYGKNLTFEIYNNN